MFKHTAPSSHQIHTSLRIPQQHTSPSTVTHRLPAMLHHKRASACLTVQDTTGLCQLTRPRRNSTSRSEHMATTRAHRWRSVTDTGQGLEWWRAVWQHWIGTRTRLNKVCLYLIACPTSIHGFAAMAKFLSGPPGGRTLPLSPPRLSDLDGGIYGPGASVASTGLNAGRAVIKTANARAAGETWEDLMEYYLVSPCHTCDVWCLC